MGAFDLGAFANVGIARRVWRTTMRDDTAPLLRDEALLGVSARHRRDLMHGVARALLLVAGVASVVAAVAFATAFVPSDATAARTTRFGRLGLSTETVGPATDGVERTPLPMYFHIEKTGGTSLVLYLMSLLAERPDQRALVQRARSEDALFDADLRKAKVLCPGSAAFLTTVFVDDAASFAGFPKPLKDGSATAWSTCALATSHQGQALQTMVRADMQRHGLDGDADRPIVPLGMFRDPTQFEQAAWRSELFMYHDDRATLGWGTLSENKFGTLVASADLADFGDDSAFAATMRDVHCRNNRDNNYQTKKLVDDVWWRFQERMDKGEDKEAVYAEAVDIALDRVENLEWVGLTHRYEESVCALAFALRKTPVDTASTNYDRGGMLGDAFKANHPHSGEAFEGEMSDALKNELYECNAMDTLLVKTATKKFDEALAAMEAELGAAIAERRDVVSKGFKNENLKPEAYAACLADARAGRAA